MADSDAPVFSFDADDPLAIEHADVLQWVKEVLQSVRAHNYWRDVELKTLAAGIKLLNADPAQARRYVLAAVIQTEFWDGHANRLRNSGKTDIERMNPHHRPEWPNLWGRRRQSAAVIFALMRRALPFTEQDLLLLTNWIAKQSWISSHNVPLGAFCKAVERFSKQQTIGDALKSALRALAMPLRNSHKKDVKRVATAIDQLTAAAVDASPEPSPASPPMPAPLPSPAGDMLVLRDLKRRLGMIPTEAEAPPITEIGPDHFALAADSPLVVEHALLTALFNEAVGTRAYALPDLAATKAGRQMLAMTPIERGRLLLAACERTVAGLLAASNFNDPPSWQSRYTATAVVGAIAKAGAEFNRAGRFDFLLFISTRPGHAQLPLLPLVQKEIRWIEDQLPDKLPQNLAEGERYVLCLLRTSLIKGPPLGKPDEEVLRLTRMIGDNAKFYLAPAEPWSSTINQQVAELSVARQEGWVALFRHCLTATASRPSSKWLEAAGKLVKALKLDHVRSILSRWFSQVPIRGASVALPGFYGDTRSTAEVIQDENATILRGLLWLSPTLRGGDEMIRLVAGVAQSAYRKVPGVGPRAVKVGNAAVYALAEMPSPIAVGHLAMLKVRVKFGTAQKEIEKAFNSAAQALKLPRDQIEEMGVPTYGMEQVGLRQEVMGDASAELRVEGKEVVLAWADAKGKPIKSVPSHVKKQHKEDLKELQAAAKDIAAMLPAQCDRIDSLFLQEKRWPMKIWRERYLDHPLVGTIARRLIWHIDVAPKAFAACWLNDRLVNVDDEPIESDDNTMVQLWHPIGRPMDDILSWRAWLERHQIRQPFKQAHRELYPLTDAERRTNTYSNRFAGHVLRQHQFNALCAARGWKSKLRLMVDDAYPPPSRVLTNWGLRAEFWIESIGDDYRTDTNDSGAFLRVATDQVRFYRLDAAQNFAHASGGSYTTNAPGPGTQNINDPLPLDQIPALVLSEVMRDVDLFVGVASVGNDPTWQDGGPGGRYREYWHSYSFGDLSQTAQTRRAVLQTLLPRLTKIKDRCRLDEKFLIVRGDLRTYKIHLGSGNILMEPNDQYLCIVPDRSTKSAGTPVFLPFEGDSTLSIILSKAFLLANDKKITDPTITRQIKS